MFWTRDECNWKMRNAHSYIQYILWCGETLYRANRCEAWNHPNLTSFQPAGSLNSNAPTFNLNLPNNPSHYELTRVLLSGISNVIYIQESKIEIFLYFYPPSPVNSWYSSPGGGCQGELPLLCDTLRKTSFMFIAFWWHLIPSIFLSKTVQVSCYTRFLDWC